MCAPPVASFSVKDSNGIDLIKVSRTDKNLLAHLPRVSSSLEGPPRNAQGEDNRRDKAQQGYHTPADPKGVGRFWSSGIPNSGAVESPILEPSLTELLFPHKVRGNFANLVNKKKYV